MCGIAGSFGRQLEVRGDVDAARLREVLAHRGPDSFGRWEEADVSLLHWRLAILDLSAAGHQPMVSADGRLVLCHNGEVYNFRELRAEVEQAWRSAGATAARRWRGHSDTEVIVEGCALWGADFLSRLNGMFAIALYDRERRTLHLARDRAGIKPLYVWRGDGVLLFASEAKFFFLSAAFEPGLDARGLTAFLKYSHCYDAHHVLAGVSQLEPGERLTCEAPEPRGPLRVGRGRLCPPPAWRPVRRSDAEATRALRDVLARAVERQLVADVPVGVLLSGGVDSSILTALTARALGPDRTMAFTLGYPGMGADYDEIAPARRVARHLGVRHHVHEASPADLVRDLERVVWHYDEPFADAAAVNVFALSRMIRSRVTVALAGEGSDELFGGYRRYQLEKALRGLGPVRRLASAVTRAARLDRAAWMPRRFRVALRALASPDAPSRYSSYLESETPVGELLQPRWLREIGTNAAIEEGYPERIDGGVVSRLCVVDQRFWLPSTYLEKSDKGAMAHSLEIRVPFLDDEVVAFANGLTDAQRIRGRRRKWLLREAFAELLPAEVFTRFKRGFGVPVARWLREELREYFADHVIARDSRVSAFVRPSVLERAFRAHLHREADHAGLLWRCLVLEIWLRHYERRFGPERLRSPARPGAEASPADAPAPGVAARA